MRRIILLLLVILVIVAITDVQGRGGKSRFNSQRPVEPPYKRPRPPPPNKNTKPDYKGDVHCSKHCVPDKAYWQGDHCSCHSGLVGAGDLCCTDPKEYEYTCTVCGDPYVHSYLGQKATVFNPCGQVLAVINAKTCKDKKCQVTVRSDDVIEQGIFVTNQVEVTLEIGRKTAEYIILDGYRYYNSFEGKWEDLGNEFKSCFKINRERVQVLEDTKRRVWTVTACGTIINFRRDTRGGKPGVCISSKYPFSSKTSDHPTENVCNRLTRPDFGDYDRHATFYLAKSFERLEYKNLLLNCAYTSLCKTVIKTFDNCCQPRKAAAMNVCATILEKDFRECAYTRNGVDGAKLFEFFGKCLKAYCDGDEQWCYTAKTAADVLHCSLSQLHCPDFKRAGGQQQIVHF